MRATKIADRRKVLPVVVGDVERLALSALDNVDKPRLDDLDVALDHMGKGGKFHVTAVRPVFPHALDVGFDAAELVFVDEAFVALGVRLQPAADVPPNITMPTRRPVVLIAECPKKTVSIALGVGSVETHGC